MTGTGVPAVGAPQIGQRYNRVPPQRGGPRALV